MYDLGRLRLSDIVECEAALRGKGVGAKSMEEVAGRTVRWLHENLRNTTGAERACALVRFFKTHPFRALPPDLQAFARRTLGGDPPDPTVRCLTLLATTGDRAEWTFREQSVDHQAIPLASEEIVERAPMISQLIRQLGLNISTVIRPDSSILVEKEQQTFNVFYVAEALGSPHIPAQADFIRPYRIHSVLGFGGLLPDGDLFAVILFSRVPVPPGVAELFRTVALAVKVAVLPFAAGPIFTCFSAPAGRRRLHQTELLQAQTSALNQLIQVHEQTVVQQAHQLEAALEQAQQAQQALEVANEELQAFSYSVSHDLRAPLRSVAGFGRALLEDFGPALPPEAKSLIGRMEAATQRMGHLIEAMLALFRVTRAELQRDTVDLSEMALTISNDLRGRQPNREVAFIIAPDMTVFADPRLLRAVLENLLENAWKFTATRPQAWIELGVTARDGQPTYFVRDNGIGFDMAYVDKLFSPFQSLHPRTEFAGTGIGLATVQRIVRRHGGQVWGEGQPDGGASFYFTLSGTRS